MGLRPEREVSRDSKGISELDLLYSSFYKVKAAVFGVKSRDPVTIPGGESFLLNVTQTQIL